MKKITAIAKFQKLENAISRWAHSVKARRIVIGDDGLFWIVTPADEAKLVKLGFVAINVYGLNK